MLYDIPNISFVIFNCTNNRYVSRIEERGSHLIYGKAVLSERAYGWATEEEAGAFCKDLNEQYKDDFIVMKRSIKVESCHG